MKIFFVYFILFLSNFSYASQARIDALQSNHLSDTELVYLFPTKLLEIKDYILFQTGSSSSVNYLQRPNVEFKTSFLNTKSDNYAIGLTLGRQNDLIDDSRSQALLVTGTAYGSSANSINLNYAVREMGNSYSIGFFYADQNDKVNQLGNKAGTMNLGLRIDDFTVSAMIGLYNYVDDPTSSAHLSINQSFSGALVYEMDDIQFLFSMNSSKAKQYILNAESANYEFLNYKMGALKNIFNGNEIIFYRIDLVTKQTRDRLLLSATKEVQLPLTLGFESILTDEIKLRSSIKQIVGVYQSDNFGAGTNTTAAAVGVGLNYKKITIDGVFQGLIGSTASQKVDANNFLTETSLTYWF